MRILLLLAVLLLPSCQLWETNRETFQRWGLEPKPTAQAAADYGTLPKNWRALAVGTFRLTRARDVEFFTPKRGWAALDPHDFLFGWVIRFDITAENAFGGLTRDTLEVLIHGDRVVAYKERRHWWRT